MTFAWKQICFLIVGSVLVGELPAQTSAIPGVNVVVQRVSTELGLSNDYVWAITQDKQGFIWIGTRNGLNRYDGKQCVVYHYSPDSTGLSDNWVWSLFADRDGSLWIGTNTGLNRFDPLTRTFKKYVHDPADPTSLSNNEVRAIYRDRAGVLWIGTKWGLNRFEDRTGAWTHFLTNPGDSSRQGGNFINAIHEDQQGTFWVGVGHIFLTGGGLFKFDRTIGSFDRCRFEPLEPKNSELDWIPSINEVASGDLWICSNQLGVYRRDMATGAFTRLPLPEYRGWFAPLDGQDKRPTTFAVKQVCEDTRGILWISTWGSGLFRYDKRTKDFAQFLPDPSGDGNLLSPHINVMFLDRAGLLWVGTDGGGINTVSDKPFVAHHGFGKSFRTANRVDGLFADHQGNLWVGAIGMGAWKCDPRTGSSVQVFRDDVLTNFCEDTQGNIWATTTLGLIRFDPRADLQAIVWALPHFGTGETTTAMSFDPEGSIWVGTNAALYRIQRDLRTYRRFVATPLDVKSFSGGSVTSILEDKYGVLWICTTAGLNRFDKGTETFVRFVHEAQDSTSLSDNYVTGVLQDSFGKVWVSTGSGLDRFNTATVTFERVLRKPVDRMITDQKGRFWFGSGRTISMFEPGSGKFRTYDGSDGIPGDGIIGSAHTLMPTGELVFGTNTGFIVFHPDSLVELSYVPPVVITGIKMFDKPLVLPTSPDLLRQVTFGHDENVFSVAYAALSYDMSTYNQYAYRLEGFDKDWVYCGNRQEATYTNLDPGTYAFRVKGSNHDGVWNETGTSLAVVVRPAYWQTWWFGGLFLMALIVSVGGVVGYAERSRARRKIERLEHEHVLERERARISQDMHDEVGSSLSEISILSELVKRDVGKPEKAVARAQEISERSGEVIENIGEIIWALNPKNDPVENLIAYLRRYAVHYLELASIMCKVLVPEDIPPYRLASAVRRNVFLVVKESLHNIVKHAAASEVRIEVQAQEKTLEIRIQDNGIGFFVEERADAGNGLGSMKKRAGDIGATIEIHSEPGCGTTVELTIRV